MLKFLLKLVFILSSLVLLFFLALGPLSLLASFVVYFFMYIISDNESAIKKPTFITLIDPRKANNCSIMLTKYDSIVFLFCFVLFLFLFFIFFDVLLMFFQVQDVYFQTITRSYSHRRRKYFG